MKIGAALFWLVAAALAGPICTAGAEDSTIADQIAALGDLKPATRDAAADALWTMGRAAEPALETAANSEDPEVAERAREILTRFRYGLSPASPPELGKLLAQYRGGTEAVRTQTLEKLASLDVRGLRVLAGLVHGASGPSERDSILMAMMPHARDAAALLIAEGDSALAGELLGGKDHADAASLRDLAAFNFFSGKLKVSLHALMLQQTSRPKAIPLDALMEPSPEPLLAYLQRAAGDLPAALEAAKNSGDDRLVDSLLVDQQKWAELAERISSWNDQPGSMEKLGCLAYCQRLAGDPDGFSRSVRGIIAFVDANPNDVNIKMAARALCLNDDPDAATDLLVRHTDFDTAAALLIHRMKLREAMAVIQAGQGGPPARQVRLLTREAEVYLREGNRDLLTLTFARAVRLASAVNDADVWGLIARVARAGADRDHIDGYVARLLEFSNRGRGLSLTLTAAGVANASLVEQWWWFLRPRVSGNNLLPAAWRVVALSRERAPSPALVAFAHEIEAAAEQFPGRAPLTALAGKTLLVAGNLDEAESYLSHSPIAPQTPAVLMQLAEVQEAMGKWKQAATSYDRAWDLDRTEPVPLFLEGLALRQAGDSATAQKLIDMAHWIPLANDANRIALLTACEEHHADADASRERDMLIRVGDTRGVERVEALGSAGAAAAKARSADAAGLLEAALFEHSGGRFAFVDEIQNIRFAALIDTTRAAVALHGGDAKAAFALARQSQTIDPLADDEYFDLINDFCRTGHLAEAANLRTQAAQLFENLLKDFPASADFENGMAWLLGHTGGNLDEALTRARRAVQLDPGSAGIADTLADVYFRRGELPAAIQTMQKCIELEPSEPHHRERLEVFQRALAQQKSPPQTQPDTQPHPS